jgi:hypothetical protein
MSKQAGTRSSEVVDNVVALFLLLGGALLSGAWALFATGLVRPTFVEDYGSQLGWIFSPTPEIILAGLGPVMLVALIGALALRRRDGALGALVVPLLVLFAAGASRIVEVLAPLLIDATSQSELWGWHPTNALISALSTLVGLLAIVLAHRIRSGRLLAFALVGWAFVVASDLREVISAFLFVNGNDLEYSPFYNQAWSLWWLLPAAGVYLYARRAAKGTDADRARASIARIFGGLALIGCMSETLGYDLTHEAFPFAAVAILGVSALLVLLALRERTTAYLWPSAVGTLAALSVLNAIYFSETLGLSGALLVEGLILLGVGGATFALRSRLIEHAGSTTDRSL